MGNRAVAWQLVMIYECFDGIRGRGHVQRKLLPKRKEGKTQGKCFKRQAKIKILLYLYHMVTYITGYTLERNIRKMI